MSKGLKRVLFLILFLLGIFAIFFLGRKFDTETGKSNFILTTKGVEHFRKWLDVHWGSRLIYKISYDTYEELYSNPAELQAIKNTIETIVLKNIDKRISALGVSDYRSYTQNVNGDNYIIVEIGWVADLEQAKEIIGKVVQLEFRFKNEQESTPEYIAERKDKAKELLNQVLKDPDMIKDLVDGREAEDIMYNNFETVKISQLPEVYQENADLLETIEVGEVYPGLLEWKYADDVKIENDEYVPVDVNGFVFFRVNDRKIEEKETVSVEDIYSLTKQFGLEFQEEYLSEDQWIEVWKYKYANNTLSANVGVVADGEQAYQIKIYEYSKSSLVALDQTGLEIEQVDTDLENIEKAISENKDLDIIDGLTLTADGRATLTEMQQRIPSFTDQEVGTTQKYDELWVSYFVEIKKKKTADETIYRIAKLQNISDTDRSKIDKLLQKNIIYSIEDVFVRDRESRIPALDTKTNKILNGAYFKYANIGRSQVGEPVVYINLNDDGKDIFCNITESHIGDQMAVFVGGSLKTAPNIRTKICGGTAQIEWWFTNDEAMELVDDLNEWNMPAKLILMQEEKISPSLGENALIGALIACVVGVLAIFTLMFLMYGRREALITLAILVMFITVLLGFMKLIDYALSLSGIAAIILSIGMWVDANILIFERIREEIKDWKTMKSAINTGYERSLAPIKDGNISTGLIALLLFMMGINMFKWFGSMMILNIILILFINVPLTRELLEIFFHNKKTYKKEKRVILKD